MPKIFNDEEINFVKSLSLTSIASRLGYTVIRKGKLHSLKEMDSLMIYNDRTWYRWSGRGEKTGGSTIDFIIEFGNIIPDKDENIVTAAIKYLLEVGGYKSFSKDEIKNYVEHNYSRSRTDNETYEKKEMQLPEKNPYGYKRAYGYLIKKRGLSADVINYFVRNKLLYEDAEHHNIVFCGYDKDKNIKFATKRGTCDIDGKRYRGDVAGNDKNYGVNIVNKNSDTINVFEACIDMMSYCDLFCDIDKTNKLALSMLSDAPLETFLKENPQIKNINLWLDNDEPGREAAEKIEKKYIEKGFSVKKNSVPDGKDVNEYLQICNEKNLRDIPGKNNGRCCP